MNTYTVIINKPDGCTTSMCCVMDQWGSDFALDANVDENDAIDKIVSAFTNPGEYGEYTAHLIGILDEKLDSHGEGVIHDAEQLVYEFDQYDSGSSWNRSAGGARVLSNHSDSSYEEVENDLNRINRIIRDKVVTILKDREALVEKQAAEEKEEKRIADEKYERQQFELLKQKFETNK